MSHSFAPKHMLMHHKDSIIDFEENNLQKSLPNQPLIIKTLRSIALLPENVPPSQI